MMKGANASHLSLDLVLLDQSIISSSPIIKLVLVTIKNLSVDKLI
jgi:hypothetical protein